MGRRYSFDTNNSESSDTGEKKVILTRKDFIEQRNKTVTKSIMAGCIAFTLIFGIVRVVQINNYQKKINDIYTQVENKREEYDNLKAKANEEVIKYVDPDIVSPYETCNKIAEYQNALTQYTWYNRINNVESLSQEHVDTLAEFKSYIDTTNSNSEYVSGTWLLLLMTATDERDDLTKITSEEYPYIWEFDTDCSFYGTQSDVTWLCYSIYDVDKERPVAVATAKYDSKTDMCSNINLYYTNWIYDMYKIGYEEEIPDDSEVTTNEDAEEE